MAPLPNEVVDRILEHLYRICQEEKRPTCAYASVSPFWQEFFERKHFRELSLQWRDFPDLNEYVVGERRKLVKVIRLKTLFGRSSRLRPKGEFYDYMITTLFETLSTWWDIYSSKSPGRVVLRISVRRVWNPLGLYIRSWPQRDFYTPLLSPSRTPPVYAVKTLMLDTNVYDVFKVRPRALHYLLRSLPALGMIVSENRYLPSTVYRDIVSSKVYERMIQSLPASVSELRLFEENQYPFSLRMQFHWCPMGGVRAHPADELSLGLCLARASRQLRNLSASFVVDARHFFLPFWPRPSTARPINRKEWVWDELETLALTSRLFARPDQNVQEVNHLLEAISTAVRRMPKLRTLEIWNGDNEDHACLFRYSLYSDSRRASLLLKGTRQIEITDDTERSWGETMRQKTGLEGEIRFEKLEITPPFLAEAVSCFLELRDRVATQKALAFNNRRDLCWFCSSP